MTTQPVSTTTAQAATPDATRHVLTETLHEVFPDGFDQSAARSHARKHFFGSNQTFGLAQAVRTMMNQTTPPTLEEVQALSAQAQAVRTKKANAAPNSKQVRQRRFALQVQRLATSIDQKLQKSYWQFTLQTLNSFTANDLSSVGIFREPGSQKKYKEAAANQDLTDLLVNDKASLLKLLLREHVELFSEEQRAALLQCDTQDTAATIQAITYMITFWPHDKRNAFVALLSLFKAIADQHATNQMTANNLAVSCGPSVVLPGTEHAPQKIISIVEFMINQCEALKAAAKTVENLYNAEV